MSKLTSLITGAALTFGAGAASAGEIPEILGAVDYQVMSTSEMASITGEGDENVKEQRQKQCLAYCSAGSQEPQQSSQQQQAQCLALCG